MPNNNPVEINLKVDKKEREDGKIQLAITVPAKTLEDVLKSAAYVLAMQNRMDLTGVDLADVSALVKETVGEAQYYAFANQYAMSAVVPHAITQKNIEPIMEPELSAAGEIVPGKDFSFVALVTPKPHYELSSYEPVTVTLPKIAVSEREIDEQVYNLAQQRVKVVADEGAEAVGDSEMVFALKTVYKDDDEPVANLTSESRYYQLGQGYLPAEFDEHIMGMKAGDSRTFDFELPLSYNPDGTPAETRTVTTTVELKQIDKRVVPAINNAWVEENMPELKDVDGLREMFRAQGIEYKTREQKNMELFAAASKLAERFTGTIPDEIYDFTRGDILTNLQEQLKANGMTIEQYMQEMGIESQQFNMMLMMQVRETLRQGFSLDALARHLKMTVSDEEIAETLTRIAPGNEERAFAEFQASGRMYMLREVALRSKANAWLAENSTYEEEE